MIKTRIGTESDIKGVLSLQEQNLYSNLSEQQRKENGFVTTPFTVIQIQEIIKQNGLFVAEGSNEMIVAYIFAGSWDYFSQWELFNYMVSRFPLLTFNGQSITTENSFQYGPVCIDRQYRGQGVLDLIFEEMTKEMAKRYPISISFINKKNKPSQLAHIQKLGWVVIDEFEYNDNSYLGLAFDLALA